MKKAKDIILVGARIWGAKYCQICIIFFQLKWHLNDWKPKISRNRNRDNQCRFAQYIGYGGMALIPYQNCVIHIDS